MIVEEIIARLSLATLPLYIVAAVVLVHVIPWAIDPYGLRKYPGPPLAALSDLWLAYAARKGERYKVIHQLHQKYGKYVRIAPNNLSIADENAVNFVLGHGNGSLKSNFYDAFVSPKYPRGLFNTRDRHDHTRKRKIVSHVFAKSSMDQFEPYVATILRQFLAKWDAKCEKAQKQSGDKQAWSEEFDGLNWYNYLAFDIIGDLAFGSPFGMIEREADLAEVEKQDGVKEYLPAVKILNERGEYSATQGCIMPWLRPYTKSIDPWFARGLTSVQNLAGIARSRVNARLKDGAGDRKDLLARLQEARDDKGNPLPKDELTMEALTMLIAGSDTTSNSSCAIQFFISKHPDVEKKLMAELKTAAGTRDFSTNGVFDYEDVKSLPYLDACINEALRRHSTSALGLPRLITEDAIFDGQVFRKGTVLSVPTYTLHHSSSIFTDPFDYQPERWLDGDKQTMDKAFMPFSQGPRSCVGRNLASMELAVFISTLLYRYEFKLRDQTISELSTVEGFLRKPTESWFSIRRRQI